MAKNQLLNLQRWLDQDNENLARVRNILQDLDSAKKVGDPSWDAAYYSFKDWKQYTTSPPSLAETFRSLENVYDRDLQDSAVSVESSRLRRAILAEVRAREEAVKTAMRRLERESESCQSRSEKLVLSADSPAEQRDVFISYASEDEALAQEIVMMLREHDLDVFHAASSIRAGDIWQESIRKALLGAKVVVLLLTPHSKEADWVMAEIGACWVLAKTLVPALNYVRLESMPQFVSRSQGAQIETLQQRRDIVDRIIQLVGDAQE